MDIDGLELISKLNFLDQEDQDQSNMSSNPFDEANDPDDLNPFGDPDEDGKEWPVTLCMTPLPLYQQGRLYSLTKSEMHDDVLSEKGMFTAAGFCSLRYLIMYMHLILGMCQTI